MPCPRAVLDGVQRSPLALPSPTAPSSSVLERLGSFPLRCRNVPHSMPQGGWGWGLGPLTWRRGPGMRALMGFVARLSQASVSTESITAQSQSKHRNSTHQSEAAEKMCSSPGEAKCALPCWPVHCLIPSLYSWSVSPYSTGWRGCCRLLVEAGELSF